MEPECGSEVDPPVGLPVICLHPQLPVCDPPTPAPLFLLSREKKRLPVLFVGAPHIFPCTEDSWYYMKPSRRASKRHELPIPADSLTRRSPHHTANMTTQIRDIETSAPREVSAETSQLERHGYLFGLHLANSWSPFLHDVIYQHLGLHWGQVRLDSSDMDLFLKLIQHPKFYGSWSELTDLQLETDFCRRVGHDAQQGGHHPPSG